MLTNAAFSLNDSRQMGSMMLASGTYGAELEQHNMLHYGGSPKATGPLGHVPRPPYVPTPGAKPSSPAKMPAATTAVPAALVEAVQAKLEVPASAPLSGSLDPTFIYAPTEVQYVPQNRYSTCSAWTHVASLDHTVVVSFIMILYRTLPVVLKISPSCFLIRCLTGLATR